MELDYEDDEEELEEGEIPHWKDGVSRWATGVSNCVTLSSQAPQAQPERGWRGRSVERSAEARRAVQQTQLAPGEDGWWTCWGERNACVGSFEVWVARKCGWIKR